jgi:DNA invertase Pin-like site-specific DNA recombinase
VPKLDRLARSVPDAREIGDTLAARGIRLSPAVDDPSPPQLNRRLRAIVGFR